MSALIQYQCHGHIDFIVVMILMQRKQEHAKTILDQENKTLEDVGRSWNFVRNVLAEQKGCPAV